MKKKPDGHVRKFWKHPTGVCEIRGCYKKVRARGWCHMHYLRWSRYGDVGGAKPINRPAGSSSSLRRDPGLAQRVVELLALGRTFAVKYVRQGVACAASRSGTVELGGPSLLALERRGWIEKVREPEPGITTWKVTPCGRKAAAEAPAIID